MHTLSAATWQQFLYGDVQSHGALAVLPILADLPAGPDYLTLGEALAAGTLTITEISEGGSVPELAVVVRTMAAHTSRHHADVAACLEAIIACVQRHTTTQRATIVEECGLSPANASIYLRRLCDEGRLVRHGEKSATTYRLP